MRIVETAIANARLTLSVLLFLMLAGTASSGWPVPGHIGHCCTEAKNRSG